ncbi:MAG: DUF885 domain-containing protein [Lachnospiraceae bacterium]
MKQKKYFLLFPAVTGSILLLFLLLSAVNLRFICFCDEIFREDLASNTLTMHYMLKHPEDFQIDTSAVTLGSFETDAKERQLWLQDRLDRLRSFPRFLLNEENTVTGDLLEYTLRTQLEGIPYTLYDEPLTPSIGIQSQLPVLLAEYAFDSTSDIETYLLLLSDFPRYIDSLINFEKAKIQAGMFMDEESAKELISFCQDFCAPGTEHFLYDTFSLRLEDVKMSREAYDSYIKRNASLISNAFFPAYRTLQKFLESSLSSCNPAKGLYHFPGGRDYYLWLIRSCIGTDRSLEEIEKLLDSAMEDEVRTIRQLVKNNPSLQNQKQSFRIDPSKTSELAEALRQKTFTDFPEIPEVSLSICHVPDSMSDYLSPAFYLTPAIDNYEENIVYLNDACLNGNLSFFTTLAHESYPGHLYQTIYENEQHHHPIRKIFYFGGYVEGWATYAEQYSYQMTGLPEDLATLMASGHAMTLNIYSHLDLYVHGFGWNEAQCADYLKKYGIPLTSVHDIYMLVRQQPANYLKYYLGYLEICNLKEQCETALGSDFSLIDFHDFLLSYGPAPFSLLRTYLEERQ